jgi:hypothetical protein
MKLLRSKHVTLPTLYFISDREKIPEIPPGVPFIYGEPREEKYIVQLLTYEVLFEAALRSGIPFKFKDILKDAGLNPKEYAYSHNTYINFPSKEGEFEVEIEGGTCVSLEDFDKETKIFREFIQDAAVYVDRQKLKDLKIFPVWLASVEDAITTNIQNFATFNPNMYNKKLGGMYGSVEFTPPGRNLIIIDISSSIPRGVSGTCLALAKNLAESFYADVLITGSHSTLYPYEEIHTLNIETIYEQNGMSNEQADFKRLLSEPKVYDSAIVFGDNDHPGWGFDGNASLSDEEGQKICKWEINTLISLHTHDTTHLAGYSRWFSPKKTERIADWVKYL